MKIYNIVNALAIVMLVVGTGLRIFHVIDKNVFYLLIGIVIALSFLSSYLRKRSMPPQD